MMKVDTFKEIIEKAPGTLSLNQTSSEKASEAGETLLRKISEQGMNDALDQECNNYLVKLKKTVDLMQERRKPVTQIFDEVKKMFTGLEGKIDQKSEIYSAIQKARNDYAAKKAAEQRQKEEEARKKLLIDKEKIDVQTKLETEIKQHFLTYQEARQQELINLFEGITLDMWDEMEPQIRAFSTAYPYTHFQSFRSRVTPLHITAQDVDLILVNVKAGKFNQFSGEFKETIQGLLEVFIDKLPSKKNELEAIARADAAEKMRLEQEAENRRQEQLRKLQEEASEKKAQAANEAQVKGQVMTANTLFDHETSLAADSASTAQVREGYEIEVTNPVGYLQIVAFYFEKAGKSEGLDKLEKKTLGSMRKFCETYAQKHDEKIQNPYIYYKEVFKAIAKQQ